MTDTPAEIERMLRNKIMARSGEERFIMGAQMFEAACEMVKASLPSGLPSSKWKQEWFKRIYGEDLASRIAECGRGKEDCRS